jgi:beta-phosphoglucomutase family hydrolase
MDNSLGDQIRKKGLKALVLDLDGVITQTALVHARAWKRMFDAYLQERGEREGKAYAPLEIPSDYRQYIDGMARLDGVRNFLHARGIDLPEGNPADAPEKETMEGLGNRKNELFNKVLEQEGVEPYPDTVAWVKKQRAEGMRTAVISASKNCQAVLQAAGVEELFEVRVDGVEAAMLGLKGKPAPDVFLEAAQRLGVNPTETAIFEDAQSGVTAGKAGGFALVVGIDRGENQQALKDSGADLVISSFPVSF